MNVSVNCLNRHSKQFLSDFLFCGITLQYFPLLRTYFFTFFTLLRKFPCLSRNYQPFNFFILLKVCITRLNDRTAESVLLKGSKSLDSGSSR